MDGQKELLNMGDVYQTYFPMIYNYVFYKILNRENTEDIVSQTFVNVMNHLSNYDAEKASVKTWIFRIADNVLIDFYRKQKPNISYDNEESGLDRVLSVDFDDQYDKYYSPERQILLSALKGLPERDRTFIYYKYFQNITNREIARRMNMNENTVAAVLARARQKLRVVLANEL